jgi:outer membrane protein assembly factor BamB
LNRPAISLSFLVFIVALPCAAADWPQFRGAERNGRADARGLPAEWSEAKNVAWKAAIPGKGWSSPALADGRMYLTSAVPAKEESGELSLRALCVDAASGKLLWNTEVFTQPPDAPRVHTKNSHASPTPLVDGSRVFVHFGHQGTAGLDTSGRVIWRNRDNDYAPVHGNGGSPVLVDGLLIFSCDGGSDPYVVALDAASGEERWRFERQTDSAKLFSFSTPAVVEIDGQKQVITPGSGVVNGLDPASGREIWRVTYGGYSVIPQPVVGHGLVFLSTGYDSPELMAIRLGGQGDVTDTHVAWTLKKGAPNTPSPLLVGNELYVVSDRGVATCVDALTGKVHWQERVGGNYSASPIYADGKIYLQSEDGPATVLKAGKTFEIVSTTGFPERTLATYAVGDDSLFIRTEKNLYRVRSE